MSANEIVAKAKEAGISLTAQLVYNVRNSAGVRAKSTAAQKPATTPAPKRSRGRPKKLATVVRSAAPPFDKPRVAQGKPAAIALAGNGAHTAHAQAEDAFVALVAQIGILRATEILESAHARVRAVLG
jgi:hypothetical protein